MSFDRKSPSTNHRPGDRSGTSTADSRDSARQSGAPDHRGPRKMDATIGGNATASRGPTHPDRHTGTGELHESRTDDGTPTGTPKDEPGTDAVTQPNRDDVHEQREHAQPREGTVRHVPRRARP